VTTRLDSAMGSSATGGAKTRRSVDFRYSPTSTWTAICHPDDPYKTLVREDGALLYDLIADLNVWCFTRVVEFGVRTDVRPVAITQRTENARTPIVHTEVTYPHVTLELTTFRHVQPDGQYFDVVLWDIRIPDEGQEFLAQLQVSARERARLFAGQSAAPSNEIYAINISDAPTAKVLEVLLVDSVYEDSRTLPEGQLAFISVPHRLEPVPAAGFGPIPALATEAKLLQPGERLRGAVVFPLGRLDVQSIDLEWVEAALETERAFWAEYDLLRLPIEIPDRDVMDMLEASVRNILQAREIVDGLPEFRVGSAVFRGLWVVDGHFLLESAQYQGYRDDARAGLEVLLRRAHADGAIAEMPFHIKETAIALATFVRQSELLGDDEILRRLWPDILRAVDFIEALRMQAYDLPEDSPAYGLLPPAFADGGIGGVRPEYTSTYWTLAGLKMIGQAAHRLGYDADAVRFRRLFDELLADFRDHAERDLQLLPDGTPYLPTVMEGSGRHTWTAYFPGDPPIWREIRPQTGTWALAQTIYPGEVFAPDDPLVRNFLDLLDSVDDEQGIPGNTAFWTYRMIWTYSASFYAHVWLYAGRPDKAIDYLYAFANHAAPTRVWREEQPVVDAHTMHLGGDMPHNWASAEFIRLVRHLLVFERGETLDLLPGLPNEWIVPGKPLRLERTPTRFGPITIRAAVDASRAIRIEVERDTTWPRQPDHVLLHVPASWNSALLVAGDKEADLHVQADGVVALPDAGRLELILRASAPPAH
jgi:hypothetical protein